MNTYGLLEIAVVGLVVGLSAWTVVRPWFKRRRDVEDRKKGACASGSSAACGSCGGCGDGGREQPVRFHR